MGGSEDVEGESVELPLFRCFRCFLISTAGSFLVYVVTVVRLGIKVCSVCQKMQWSSLRSSGWISASFEVMSSSNSTVGMPNRMAFSKSWPILMELWVEPMLIDETSGESHQSVSSGI